MLFKNRIQNFQIYKVYDNRKIITASYESSGNECLAAFGVAIVFIVIMISVSSVVFKRGIFNGCDIVIGILAGIIILQFIIMWTYQRQVKDVTLLSWLYDET